jgi:hypothetical protein
MLVSNKIQIRVRSFVNFKTRRCFMPFEPMFHQGGLRPLGPVTQAGPMDSKPGITSGDFTPRPVFPSPNMLDGRRIIPDSTDKVRDIIRWPK